MHSFRLTPTPLARGVHLGSLMLYLVVMSVAAFNVPQEQFALLIGFAALLFLLLGYLLAVAPYQAEVSVGDTLRVSVPPYARREYARDAIVSARVLDWQVEDEYKPRWKLGGEGLPGYWLGHFSLRNGRRAILMTASSRVLAVDVGDRLLLLAPDEFESFVATFDGRFGTGKP